MIDAVIARLEDQIGELRDRVRGAGDLAELTRSNRLPQVTPAAHVVPLGLRGGQADGGAGAYTQPYSEAIGVILTVRSQDVIAKRVLDDLRGFILRIIDAIAGWVPPGGNAVFTFARAELASSRQGTFIYQIDFAISDQLRILS
ncbi:MAG: hypothetical protein AAF317_07490 [Pseudomonadota bacterium]